MVGWTNCAVSRMQDDRRLDGPTAVCSMIKGQINWFCNIIMCFMCGVPCDKRLDGPILQYHHILCTQHDNRLDRPILQYHYMCGVIKGQIDRFCNIIMLYVCGIIKGWIGWLYNILILPYHHVLCLQYDERSDRLNLQYHCFMCAVW